MKLLLTSLCSDVAIGCTELHISPLLTHSEERTPSVLLLYTAVLYAFGPVYVLLMWKHLLAATRVVNMVYWLLQQHSPIQPGRRFEAHHCYRCRRLSVLVLATRAVETLPDRAPSSVPQSPIGSGRQNRKATLETPASTMTRTYRRILARASERVGEREGGGGISSYCVHATTGR